MASIQRRFHVDIPAERAWDAIRDVGALHTRLVTGFVRDCRVDGDARIVTFSNGLVAREAIVSLDDEERRLVWSATGGRLTHHNASLQVLVAGDARCELVWIADLLPNAMAPAIAAMIDDGVTAMKRTLAA